MMLLKGNGGEGKSRIGVVMQKMLGDNRRGAYGRENAPYAPLFCPADGGQATQRQRNRWQQEKTDMVAG